MSKATSRIASAATVLGLFLMAMISLPALAGLTFTAADGEPVYATLSKAQEHAGAIVLLFHQAGANRHEYEQIAPRLNRLGFDTLAVDQRSGGSMFGHGNETVRESGGSGSYLEAYADLKGALDWARRQHYQTIVAVGSSYSASLALRLAALEGRSLAGVAAFSPGEYFGDPDLVKDAVADINVPTYITTDPDEENRVDEVVERANKSLLTRYQPAHGIHGASTLDPDRDPAGYKANWQDFRSFMERFAPDNS